MAPVSTRGAPLAEDSVHRWEFTLESSKVIKERA